MQSFDASGTETSIAAPVRLDDGLSSAAGDPVLTRADDGALAAAWKVEEHGAGAVAVLERRADGTPNRQLVSAPHGGAVHQLDLGGSHHGDALIAFLQGDGANTQIAALAVRAPPGEFVLDTPASWVNDTRIPLQWETPLAGAGKLTYSVLVDDREVAENITSTETMLTGSEVSNGVHTIQVEATDSLGQVVDSEPSTLKVDRKPPTVSVRVRGGTVTVRVSDGPKGESSGVNVGSVHVSFGDKDSAHGRAKITHRYKVGRFLHDHGHRLGQRRQSRHHASAGIGVMSPRLASGVVTRLLSASVPEPRLVPGVLTLLCALLAFAAPAYAIYGPAAGGLGAEIVSVDNASDEQGDAPTTDAAISANGQYVVFQTRATNFFEDDGDRRWRARTTRHPARRGRLSLRPLHRANSRSSPTAARYITEGPEAGKLIFRGAQNPSISADGRYIAFSTAQQLVPQDTNENVDVYVRDMDVPLTADRQESGAYTLVSAQRRQAKNRPHTTHPTPPLPGEIRARKYGRDTAISRQRALRVVPDYRTGDRIYPVDGPVGNRRRNDSCSCATSRPRRRRWSAARIRANRSRWAGQQVVRSGPRASAPMAQPSPGYRPKRRNRPRFLPGEVEDSEPSVLPVAALAGTRAGHPPYHRDRRPRRP